jgi:hypothetical protein
MTPLDDNPIGRSALLRLSGFPIAFWLSASNPSLFALARRLDEAQAEYARAGARLADAIGADLVPCVALPPGARALALGLRRRLHNGLPVDAAACRRLAAVARALGRAFDRLGDDLDEAADMSRAAEAMAARLADATAREQTRIARVAVELASSAPIARVLLRDRHPSMLAEVDACLGRDETCESRGWRRRAEYLWKIVDRAATKSTPRDWHGHVALVAVGGSRAAVDSLEVSGDVATAWCENIHSQRRSLAAVALRDAKPEVRLSLTPLHWIADESLRFWVVDPDDPLRMMEIEMKRTPTLDAVREALGQAARTVEAVEAALLPERDDEQRDVLRKFVEHLIGLGVLQVSSVPRARVRTWHSLAREATEPPAPDASPLKADGFLDVYRRSRARLPLDRCLLLQRRVEQAQRLLAAIESDRTGRRSGGPGGRDEGPRPLLEVVQERFAASLSGDARPRETLHWPPALDPESAYARLLRHVAERADDEATIDIGPELLDGFGAPDGGVDWPVDCVVRMPRDGADFDAVLDEMFPAGSLDARFVATLRALHKSVPQADSYREFLEVLERRSGVAFLELLVPPLSVGAANAVRRPAYTRLWTGDADAATYGSGAPAGGRYVPLGDIRVRRVSGRLRAEVDGRPVCPVYHATRLPLTPWNFIAETLLSAAPLPLRWSPRRLHHSLDAFPDRTSMPRITVGGGLVVSCAQWRLSAGEIWSPALDAAAKVRALDRLRRARGLPRWVFVSPPGERKPVPCDLESIRAIRVFERAAERSSGQILVVEMLPSPEQLALASAEGGGAERIASSLMLRLPCDESPAALATRLAPAFAQRAG